MKTAMQFIAFLAVRQFKFLNKEDLRVVNIGFDLGIEDYLKFKNITWLGAVMYPILAPIICLVLGWVLVTNAIDSVKINIKMEGEMSEL